MKDDDMRESRTGTVRLPDLENGYLVMGMGAANRWQTGIETLLTRTLRDGEEQHAYLSHECRAEGVGDRIFGDARYEFVAARGWEGNVLLRGGSYNYGFDPRRNHGPAVDCSIHETSTLEIAAYCPERAVTYWEFDTLLARYRDEPDRPRSKVFLDIRYFAEGLDYRMILPARYVNFPGPENDAAEPYLQPISGQALFTEGGRFDIAYVAAHLTRHGTQTLELMLRRPTSFIATKNRAARLYPSFAVLDRLVLRHVLRTDDYCVRRELSGECRLFSYEPFG